MGEMGLALGCHACHLRTDRSTGHAEPNKGQENNGHVEPHGGHAPSAFEYKVKNLLADLPPARIAGRPLMDPQELQ